MTPVRGDTKPGAVQTSTMTPRFLATTLAGPMGPLQVAATDRGIVAAEWMAALEDFEVEVGARMRGRAIDPGEARRRLDAALPVFEALIAGERVDTTAVDVDLADRPAWDRAVLGAVRRIGWGETASYGEIARMVGNPLAARAVGGALGRNPVALLVPCHRIIAADGTIGGYGGFGRDGRLAALERKRLLLLREGVTVAERGD
jgi:methylated-DNA-[protein]-cysteine S-methyltransferase